MTCIYTHYISCSCCRDLYNEMEGVLRFKEVSQVIEGLVLKWDDRMSSEIQRASCTLDWMNASVRDIHIHKDDADVRGFVFKNKPDCVQILRDTRRFVWIDWDSALIARTEVIRRHDSTDTETIRTENL